MGHVDMVGGCGGGEPPEDPQRESIARESSEEEDSIEEGKEEECGKGGAEGESRRGEWRWGRPPR